MSHLAKADWHPCDWISVDEYTDGRRLVGAIVKGARAAINRAVRTAPNRTTERAVLNLRATLNAANKYATALYQRTDELAQAWADIIAVAHAMGATPDEADRLAVIRSTMLNNRAAELGNP
ncbi:hypothetical protein [Kitasatospora sp. NPDC001683]